MDYADKISSFVSNFDEQQNDFLTVQSLKQQVGEQMERKGEQNIERVGVQLPLAEAGRDLVKKVFGSGAKKAASTTTKDTGEAAEESYKANLASKTTDELAGNIEDNPFSFKNLGSESSTDATTTGAATTDAATVGASTTESTIAAAATPAATTEAVVSSAATKVAGAVAGEGEVVGEVVGEAVGLISLETIGTAIPILGAIAGIFVGIRDLIKGHHEEQNTNQTFQMPKGNIDVPTYNPGVS